MRRLRRGLWALDPAIEPFVVAPYLTAPFPAYVSLWSALSHHGMIEQIPGRISIASLDRARRIVTTVGTYAIHHLAPEVFGGFGGSEESGYLATPEKALFDVVYVRAASGSRAFFPEVSLPAGFDRDRLRSWTDRIGGSRLRTLVNRRIREVLRQASSPR
jgi:predicted transcriptional regulator of viral defense system